MNAIKTFKISNFSVLKEWKLVYFFVNKVNITETLRFLGINRKTISGYYFSFKKAVNILLRNDDTILKWADRLVQIDKRLALKKTIVADLNQKYGYFEELMFLFKWTRIPI